MAQVTVLGMGAMGARMAKSLLKAGHNVTVWNRDREKTLPLADAGAKVAATPRDAVGHAEFAISMLRDDEAARQVWLDSANGALARLPAHAIAIESSTVTVDWARELARACLTRGIACIDAPVAGSRPQADAAQLIYFVGGDAGTVAQAEFILKAMGSAVHHAGPAGSGAALKLIVNALFGVQVAALAELIGLMQCYGFDTVKAVEIIASTPVCSPAAKAAAGAMLARQYAPMFPLELVAKDFGYALAMAVANNAPLPVAQTAANVFAAAIDEGHGADNITGVVQVYQDS